MRCLVRLAEVSHGFPRATARPPAQTRTPHALEREVHTRSFQYAADVDALRVSVHHRPSRQRALEAAVPPALAVLSRGGNVVGVFVVVVSDRWPTGSSSRGRPDHVVPGQASASPVPKLVGAAP